MRPLISVVCLALLMAAATPLPAAQESGPLEAKVKTLMVDPRSQSPVVVLETVQDKQILPIWIDLPEARAIALELEKVDTPRPLTHDLIRNLLQLLGATLNRVTITEIKNNTYFAVLALRFRGQDLQVDARPSDAIAVALRMKAPIYASKRVLEQAQPLPVPNVRAERLRQSLRLQAQDLTLELASLLDLPDVRGVLVADVEPGGPAMAAGIQRGDIITKANGAKVQSVRELEGFFSGQQSSGRIVLEIIKKGKPTVVLVDLPS